MRDWYPPVTPLSYADVLAIDNYDNDYTGAAVSEKKSEIAVSQPPRKFTEVLVETLKSLLHDENDCSVLYAVNEAERVAFSGTMPTLLPTAGLCNLVAAYSDDGVLVDTPRPGVFALFQRYPEWEWQLWVIGEYNATLNVATLLLLNDDPGWTSKIVTLEPVEGDPWRLVAFIDYDKYNQE